MGQAVESGGGVQSQDYLVGCLGFQPSQNPVHLAQFLHQVGLGVQPAGGVDDQDIGATRLAGLIGVKGDCAGVTTGFVPYNIYADLPAQDFQLLGGSGPESVRRAQDDFLSFLCEMMGQLGDAGGLAHSVDAHHQYHIRPGNLSLIHPDRFGVFRLHPGNQRLFERFKDILTGLQSLLFDSVLQFFDQPEGCFYSHVGRDQYLFKFLPNGIVQFGRPEDV